MKNKKALKALLNLNDDTIIRVYPDQLPHVNFLEYVIMIEGNDRSEDAEFAVAGYLTNIDMNDWVNHSEDARFGGDGSLEIKTDDLGEQYVEWRNGDFWNPFTSENMEDQIHLYGS